jgi:methylenetetrahydrofolate dehydrogenase (NADP+)/methenyltetrahydrofolate cyclohydrolase
VAGQIIDGKAIAKAIRTRIKTEVASFTEEYGFAPGLAVIIVGEDPASQKYVASKKSACKRLGLHSEEYCLPESAPQKELLELIEKINSDSKIHGLLVQRPLPRSIDTELVTEAILPSKDVDCFHSSNIGHMLIGDGKVFSCTPLGIIRLLENIDFNFKGSKAVVVGRSNIVGKPVALMLLQKNCTVTICHSRTRDLEEEVKTADLVIAAVGRANMIKGSWIKPGACVIDVGINSTAHGQLTGDVDFESAKEVAGWITPVPGGVGPMTIAMLMENTLSLAKEAVKEKQNQV